MREGERENKREGEETRERESKQSRGRKNKIEGEKIRWIKRENKIERERK